MNYLKEYTIKKYSDKRMVHCTNKLELLMVLLLYVCVCVCVCMCVCVCVCVSVPGLYGHPGGHTTKMRLSVPLFNHRHHHHTEAAKTRSLNYPTSAIIYNSSHLQYSPIPLTPLPSYNHTFSPRESSLSWGTVIYFSFRRPPTVFVPLPTPPLS